MSPSLAALQSLQRFTGLADEYGTSPVRHISRFISRADEHSVAPSPRHSPLKGRATAQMNGGWKERDQGWRQRKEDEECIESDYVTEGGITRASFRETASSLPDARNPFWFRRMLGIMQSAACGDGGGGAAIILQSWRNNEREKVLGLFIHFVMSPTNAKCLSRHRTSPVAWQQSGEKQEFVRAAVATCEAKDGRRHTRVDCKL